MHKDSIKPGQKVVIIDDLIATGGTVEACAKMIERLGGERFVQIVSNRHTENEAAGLGSADYITVYFFYKMLHLIYGKLQSVCVLQDTRYISENNTRFREIRNTSYVILYFFHKIFLRFVKV